MPALLGRNMVLKVSTAVGGTYATIAYINDASLKHKGNPVDVSVFGDNWHERLYGLRDWSIDGKGYYTSTDTNGQVAIRTALVNASTLFATILLDGATGFKGEVIVDTYDVQGAVERAVTVNFVLMGTSAISAST